MFWEWLGRLWYELLYYPVAAFFLFFFSLRVKGRRNVPPTGGLLVLANHQSFLDPPLVGVAVRRRLRYLARKTLFRPRLFAWLIRSLGAIPIDQEVGTEGIKAALHLLHEGKAVLVFPEGRRTPDGRMQPLKPGVVILIRRARVPVLPVGIAGAFDAFPIHARLPRLAPLFAPPRPGTLAVVIGEPIPPECLADLPPDEMLADLGDVLSDLHRQADRLRLQKR
jgi:1-acyl-sn-glycerol-3-phosphate acyltransferase